MSGKALKVAKSRVIAITCRAVSGLKKITLRHFYFPGTYTAWLIETQ
jgi:hypothetical protein